MKTGRVVLITGAAGGMGASFVERFLANGDTVIATDTSKEQLLGARENAGPQAKLRMRSANISDEASCNELARVAGEKAGRVNVLINSAGFFPAQSLDELTPADWNQVIGIELPAFLS